MGANHWSYLAEIKTVTIEAAAHLSRELLRPFRGLGVHCDGLYWLLR